MTNDYFPPLALADWRSTRDTVRLYARLLSKIRAAYAPRQKHWWHVSLRPGAVGLTTTPFAVDNRTVELTLALAHHALVIETSHGDGIELLLEGQSPRRFLTAVLDALEDLELRPELDESIWLDDAPGSYDETAVLTFWQAASQMAAQLERFKGGFRGETSPVNFWSHHFDLSLVWLTGRLVPGHDPDDEEKADEQMSFGFSSGDQSIPEAYCYVGAYPWSDAIAERTLPAGAYWHSAGFKGAVLPYARLAESADPLDLLFTYWRAARDAGIIARAANKPRRPGS